MPPSGGKRGGHGRPYPQVAPAADVEAGRQKAQTCGACHGPGGNSVNPAMPSLAGQPKQFIVTQLFMFREGNRKNPQMSPLAKNLTNADLNDIAAYFSAQPLAPLARVTAPDINILADYLAGMK